MMNLTKEDPRLTALALGELPAEEAQNLHAEIANSLELQRELADINAVTSFLEESLGKGSLELGGERREEIFRTGQRPDSDVILLENQKRSRRHAFAVLAGAAAVVVLGVSVLLNATVESDQTPDKELVSQDGASAMTVAGKVQLQGGSESSHVFSQERAVNSELLPLPLSIQELDFRVIEKWLSEKRASLPEELTKPASWVNAVEPTQQPMVTIEGLDLSVEVAASPWNQKKNFLLVTVRSARLADVPSHSFKGSVMTHSERVRSIKLISDDPDETVESQWGSLKAGESQTMLYEIELEAGEGKIGAINLDTMTLNGEERSAYLPILKLSAEVSQDFRLATLMARFSQWNREKQTLSDLHKIARDAEELFPQAKGVSTRRALDLILLARDLVQ